MTSGSFGRALAEGRVAFGSFHEITDPIVVEMACAAGVDFVAIDCEHGVRTDVQVLDSIRAADSHGVDTLVRVMLDEPLRARRFLEVGAAGLIVSHARREDIRLFLEEVRFPPEGHRGAGFYRSISRSGTQVTESVAATANEQLLVFPIIEDVDAAEDVDGILQLDGVSGVVPGPADLRMSMGYLDSDDPRVTSFLESTVRRAAETPQRIAMTLCADPASAVEMIQLGARSVLFGLDTYFVQRDFRDLIEGVQSALVQ